MLYFAASYTSDCLKLLNLMYRWGHSNSLEPSHPLGGFDSPSRHPTLLDLLSRRTVLISYSTSSLCREPLPHQDAPQGLLLVEASREQFLECSSVVGGTDYRERPTALATGSSCRMRSANRGDVRDCTPSDRACSGRRPPPAIEVFVRKL